MTFDEVCKYLKEGANDLALHNSEQKNKALACVAESILENKANILEANTRDVSNARAKGMTESLVERLALDEKKFKSIIDGINIVIQQADPVGQETAGWCHKNGMQIRKIRVPMGVVAIIYESRPNVTVDAFALAYKSGNSILLRGSSSALESNKALTSAIKSGLEKAGTNGVVKSIHLLESGAHEEVNEILTAKGKIDVILPRGSAKLINLVVDNAKIPVIETGAGICHLYIDSDCDLKSAAEIAGNAKMQRPGACNAIETILVNKTVAKEFLPLLSEKFADKVEIRADETCYSILEKAGVKKLVKASEDDFGFEFLDFICSVKIVDNVKEAVDFINSHNTKHSECIVTNNRANARYFQNRIDAACVYVNASTRFTDGGEFGFGAELGISTQKLHARGPMGCDVLTTTKYLIDGDGQIR